MRKNYVLLILISLLTFTDVYACGEIKTLKSNVGSVSVVDSSTYLVTVPEGTKEVTLTGTTDYEWIDGFAPRKVSTSGVQTLKVDGAACGFGIYTYFVKFKELSNIIAENDTEPEREESNTATEGEAAGTGTEAEIEEGTTTEDKDLLLTELTIEGYDIAFDPSIFEYSLEVGLDVRYLDITAHAEDGVVVTVSSNAYGLVDGENDITITLLDENGNTNVYSLMVNRVAPKSDNNFLASIQVAGYQLNFQPSEYLYTLGIGKEKTLNLTIETQDGNATYTVLGNANLKDGSEITITVEAENGDTRDYIIRIERVFNIMDYWIYILILGLVVLLLILLTISKKKKSKKKAEPKAIEAQTETAGSVQEVASQNVANANEQVEANPNGVAATQAEAANVPAGTLKIIEPTNLDNQEGGATENHVDEVKSPTEVFKL